MAPALALLLLQAPLTAEAIHAEDAKVIERALRRSAGYSPVWIPDRTFPWGRATLPQYLWGVDPDAWRSFAARNSTVVSLSGFRLTNKGLRLVKYENPMRILERSMKAALLTRGKSPYIGFLTLINLPGYSKDRSRALFRYTVVGGIHSLHYTVLLIKKRGAWQIVSEREFHYM